MTWSIFHDQAFDDTRFSVSDYQNPVKACVQRLARWISTAPLHHRTELCSTGRFVRPALMKKPHFWGFFFVACHAPIDAPVTRNYISNMARRYQNWPAMA
jgi:hypothetical protein